MPVARARLTTFALLVSLLAGCQCGADDARERAPSSTETRGGESESSRGRAEPFHDRSERTPPAERFQVVDAVLGLRARRARGWADLDALRSGDPAHLALGNFLCRLWTHFGPPGRVDDGAFLYVLRDRDTGYVVTAYADPAGPAFGARMTDDEGNAIEGAEIRMVPVVDALAELVDTTTPEDCEMELGDELGRMRIGVRGGEWFEENVD